MDIRFHLADQRNSVKLKKLFTVEFLMDLKILLADRFTEGDRVYERAYDEGLSFDSHLRLPFRNDRDILPSSSSPMLNSYGKEYQPLALSPQLIKKNRAVNLTESWQPSVLSQLKKRRSK